MPQTPTEMRQKTDQWLQNVVIGLNLCPFAKHPYQQQRIHLTVSVANSEQTLLTDLATEAQTLLTTPLQQRETTVIILQNLLHNFADFNQFLDLADALLEKMDWQEQLQIASFHPHYQFAGTQPEEAENLTNRSPYPLLHLIRQQSIETALEHYPDSPESIFEKNIQTVQQLTCEQKQALFPYLVDD